eukprot:g21161.t1
MMRSWISYLLEKRSKERVVGAISNGLKSKVVDIEWCQSLWRHYLPTPWPRCQDIRTMHEEPAAGDSLVVVSQSWSHQMHPDPTGVKALEIIAAVKNVAVKLRAEGRLLVFCDFLSMPQPPMTPEQEPWTKEDSLAVQQVMEALPQLMFKADAVIHIIGTPGKLMMGEGEKYHTTFKERLLLGSSFG